MSDDLDKFVLQYTVDLRDSIESLRKLHEKMSGVKTESQKSAESVRDFAADAAGEMARLVPGLEMVSKAVRGMGTGFTVAALALGTLAASVKAVIDLRNQYNAQRQLGMDLGVSSDRVENYQRGFVRASGGYVDRDQAMAGLKHFRDMTRAAYSDPTRMGKDALILRRFLGVNVGDPGHPNSYNNDLTQLAAGLQGKSQGEVQGIAQATGFTQDFLMTLQKLGPAIGQVTEMSSQEIQERNETQASLEAYNKSLADLKSDYNQLEIQLGQKVLPAMDGVLQFFTSLAGALNTISKHSRQADLAVPGFGADQPSNAKPSTGEGWWDKLTKNFWEIGLTPEQKKAKEDKKKQEENAKQQQAAKDKEIEKQDQTNQQAQATQDQLTLSINQFAAAVGEFAGTAPSIQEVLAAWAGGAGAAAGLPSGGAAVSGGNPGTAATGGGTSWKDSAYSAALGASAKKYGLDPQDLYAIMMVESGGINGKYSSTGAGGLMQVTKGNWKAYGGGRNVMDTSANIEVGARIFAESLKMAGGDKTKGLLQYNGHSDPDYIRKFNAFHGGAVAGYSRATIQQRETASALASALGVPVEQLLRGGVDQKAVAFAIGGARGKLENSILADQSGIASLGSASDPTSQMRLGGLQRKLREDQLKLANLNAYGSKIMQQNAGGQFMPPSIGQQLNTFNITSSDPKEIMKEIEHYMNSSYSDSIAQSQSGRKS